MPRLPRYFVPGLPLHVIQRGNDRTATFRAHDDFAFYRACLARASRTHGVAIHAYVLMTNHVHVLATPRLGTSMPGMMQSIGRLYVKYFNDRYGRTGTLWEGRYKATVVDDENYLLACMRYIELNPVRASMVTHPQAYPWSSFAANAGGDIDGLIDPHDAFRALGRSPAERRAAYRMLFQSPIADEDVNAIRDATQHAWALGTPAFRERVTELGRRADRIQTGRRPKRRVPSETPL